MAARPISCMSPMMAETLTMPDGGRSRELSPGAIVDGTFRILAKIGCGGMGTVYLAEDAGPLRRRCAVKVLDCDKAGASGHGRFLDEARIMASLRHPNIVPVTRFGTDATTGLDYYVMDEFMPTREERARICQDILHCRVPGISDGAAPLTLSRLLDGGLSLPEESVISVALQLLSAMEAAHSLSPPVVHRDIKPSNILFAPDGRALLSDFGIAKRLSDGHTSHNWTSPNATPGTWAYSAPEQRAGGVISTATDFYSFGLVVFQMLTGGMPNSSASLPLDIAKSVSQSWQPLFRALLEHDPARRLSDAKQVRSALESMLASSRRRRARGNTFKSICGIAARAAFAACIAAAAALGLKILRSQTKDMRQPDYERPAQAAGKEIELPSPDTSIGDADAPFPDRQWAAQFAKSLRDALATAIENPAQDEDGRITVRMGQCLFSGDIPSADAGAGIVLDGGRLLFAPPAKEVAEIAGKFEDFAASAPPGTALPPLPKTAHILFGNPVQVTEKGGKFDCIDGEFVAPRVIGPVSRASGVANATLDVFGLSSITLNRQTLDPGLSITGSGRIADISSSGRVANLAWFDPDSPLPRPQDRQ